MVEAGKLAVTGLVLILVPAVLLIVGAILGPFNVVGLLSIIIGGGLGILFAIPALVLLVVAAVKAIYDRV